MGQVLIRQVSDSDIAELKAQAERENISLEQRLRNLLSEAARKDRQDFWALARVSREATFSLQADADTVLNDSREELLARDPLGRR